MTRQHGLRAADAKGEAQGHHSLAILDFAGTRIACAQDDQFRSLQIEERRFQPGKHTILCDCAGDLSCVICARQSDTATHEWIFPIVWSSTARRTKGCKRRIQSARIRFLELLIRKEKAVRG